MRQVAPPQGAKPRTGAPDVSVQASPGTAPPWAHFEVGRRTHHVRRAVVIVAALRVVLGLAGWLSLKLLPPTHETGNWLVLRVHSADPLSPVVGPWQRWDALWYQHLAMTGYRHHSVDAAFFPFYPALTRAVAIAIGHRFALAALVISTIALGAALVWLQRLVAGDFDEQTARRTALYLALAPTAFFLVAPYSEALFLALSAAAFLAARRRHWSLVALSGVLAGLTRPTGLLLTGPLLVEAGAEALERRRRGLPPLRPAHAAAAGPVLAALGYFVYAVTRLETPGGPLGAERAWRAHFVPPWRALSDSFGTVLRGERPEELVNFLAATLLLVGIPLMVRRFPLSYVTYAVLMALPICSREAYASPLMSSARFVVVVFPLFVLLAQAAERRIVDVIVRCSFPAVMLALFVGYVHYWFVG